MRIRFTSYFYPPCIGGGEVILQHQAEELVRRGHEVHVHTTPYTNMDGSTRVATGHGVEGGVHVHRHASTWVPMRLPLEKNALTPGLWRVPLLPADLHVCVGFPSLHLHAASHLGHVPVIAQNYVTADFLAEILAGEGGWNKRVRSVYWQRVVRGELARARLVLADSPAAGRALQERLGLDNVRVHIGMAVDPAEFGAVTPARVTALRAGLGLGGDRLVVAASRLSRQKGADLLVDAVRPLLRDGWRLVLAGPVNEPGFHAQVLQAIGGHPRMHLTQLDRADVVALLSEASVVALPSRGETVGGVVFEGMYARAVCIVSDAVEAAREDYLVDGVNGLLVPSGDVPALRAALRRAMDEPLVELRAAGRATVEARFTWRASVDRLLTLYAEALDA